jgi:dephospho-CoA kinase
MFRIGLTGGIGSGKSTVAALLAQAGAGVVDADAISRQVTAPNGPAIETLRLAFGPEYIAADHGLDRNKIRQLVFSDPPARKRLENIIHPLVHQEAQLQSKRLVDGGCPCIVFDIPLLVESSFWRQYLDKVLVIDCSVETQIQRTSQRSHLAPSIVEQMILAQASRGTRLKAADLVICNDSLTLQALAQEVAQIHQFCGL